VGCKRRAVDAELDEPLARSGRDAKWESKMCADVFGRGVDDEGDMLFACPGHDTTWGCKASVGAVWRMMSGVGVIGHATCGVGTVMAKDGREKC
jgi:hypothetical protein